MIAVMHYACAAGDAAARGATVDDALARHLARIAEASRGGGFQVRACWRNSVLALAMLDDPTGAARYVEGWVVCATGLVIEHGWVERPGLPETGPGPQILDVTLGMRPDAVTLLAGATYCAGVAYAHAATSERIAQGQQPPFVWTGNGFGGFRHAAYRQAHHRAMTLATGASPWDDVRLRGDTRG